MSDMGDLLRNSPWLLHQREQCRQCTHRQEHQTNGAWRCAVTPSPQGRRVLAYCIDAREPNTPCGPDGLLFLERYR